jgi:hypothetical protein
MWLDAVIDRALIFFRAGALVADDVSPIQM